MAEILGANDIASLALPAGIDGGIVAEWNMREGRPFGQFVNDLSLALSDFNSELVRRWGWVYSVSQEPALEYDEGATVTPTPEITELDDIVSVAGELNGHMLPLKLYGEGVGGSWKYFQRTREAKVRTDLSTKVNRLKWRFERNLFTRLMTNTENAIGSGYDVPFAKASGSVSYTPPAYGGQSFDSTHNHFLGVDSDTLGFDDMLDQMAEHLEEHGHEAPFTAYVSRADVAAGSYKALTNFVQYVSPVINVVDRGGATSGNRFFTQGTPMVADGGIIGHYQSDFGLIEIRSTNRLTTGYAWMGKSYGETDSRNPLVVRVAEEGFGAYLVVETSDNNQWPVKRVAVVMEHGVGVGSDRTNGVVALLVSGGAFANPTIG